jgi:hypothetical protein
MTTMGVMGSVATTTQHHIDSLFLPLYRPTHLFCRFLSLSSIIHNNIAFLSFQFGWKFILSVEGIHFFFGINFLKSTHKKAPQFVTDDSCPFPSIPFYY